MNLRAAIAPELPASTSEGAQRSGDPNYYQKLTNLFPAEALAIYGTGAAIYGRADILVVTVGLAILLVFRTIANQQRDGSAIDWRAVAVAVASYLFWVTANDPSWLVGYLDKPTDLYVTLQKGAAFLGAALVLLAPILAPTPAQDVA